MADWTRITFLESAENLKIPLKRLTGRTASTSLAREVGVCLQQGRLFYQSSEQSALEIRPLLLFYGTLAFAKALFVGRTLKSIATLPQSHGISDISAGNARLKELVVAIGSCGTFQGFNDTVAHLNRFEYFDLEKMTQSFVLPTASSDLLQGVGFTLKEILSRVPGLETIYRRTYQEPANTEAVITDFQTDAYSAEPWWTLQINDRELYLDRASLMALIRKWRDRFPMLERMRMIEAVRVWDHATITFCNIAVPPDELEESRLKSYGTRFAAVEFIHIQREPRLPRNVVIGPDGGGFSGARCLVSPYQGVYLSKYSLHYLGMFLLSSLVRYRPQTWVHAISRAVTGEKPSDDQALTLLEAFMNLHYLEIPAMIADVFTS